MEQQKPRRHDAPSLSAPGGDRRVLAADLQERLAEREARIAGDNRAPAQRWLNDPPATQSALAQRK